MFPETLEERKQALEDFKKNFLEAEGIINKKMEIIINDNNVILFNIQFLKEL